MNKLRSRICVGLLFLAAGLQSQGAWAQQSGVSATGKGIVGCGLLGAEVVVIGEAIAGLDDDWLYLAGAGIGAVGGATGGYFLEPSMSPRVAVSVLMGGLALSIPALIVALDATRKHWPEPTEMDQPEPSSEPPPNPPDPGAGPELALQKLPNDVSALLRWNREGVGFGIPAVYVTNTYTLWERWAYALPQGTNYNMPLINARF